MRKKRYLCISNGRIMSFNEVGINKININSKIKVQLCLQFNNW